MPVTSNARGWSRIVHTAHLLCRLFRLYWPDVRATLPGSIQTVGDALDTACGAFDDAIRDYVP